MGVSTTGPAISRRPWSFQGQRGINAVFGPTNLPIYRALLPVAFEMPSSPMLAVAVVNYCEVGLPLTPYGEGYVAMQCRHKGRVGWYVFTMPVDDETASAGGRTLGFPKYVADSIGLVETDGVWKGSVAYQGRTIMEVTFTPKADAQPVETSSTDAGLPIFLLLPPGEGPLVNEVVTQLSGPRRTVTRAGSATVRADPGEPWAALLPTGGASSWATFDEMSGDWVLTGKQL
ncbi:MAG: acetoacetate decarboxylase family protein [Actinomycetota bacterium]